MQGNKINMLNALKSISASKVDSNAIIEAIKAMPTPEMELKNLIERQRQKQEATVKNMKSVVNTEKIIAAPVEVPIEPKTEETIPTIDKRYLDLLKGVK